MKKKISIVIVLLLTLLSLPNFAFAKKNISDSEVKTAIEKYFKTVNDILISGDLDNINLLNSQFFNPESNKTLKYECSKIKYLITSNQLSKTLINDIKTKYNYDSINYSNDDTITINMDVTNILKYSFSNEYEGITNHHAIVIKNVKGSLYLLEDIYTDELKQLYGPESDFTKPIEDIKNGSGLYNEQSILDSSTKNQIVTPNIVPGDYTILYNRSDAVYYANKYTDNTGGSGSTYYNNSQFKYFSYGNDCQNYVSQCVWYGFGGRSSSPTTKPMYNDWYANTAGTSSTWNWTYVPNFFNHITSNYANNWYGVQGYETSASGLQVGDYVYTPSHVMMVVSTDGTYKNTKISAHTSNRLNVSLATLYGATQPSNMKFVHILRVKWNDGEF